MSPDVTASGRRSGVGAKLLRSVLNAEGLACRRQRAGTVEIGRIRVAQVALRPNFWFARSSTALGMRVWKSCTVAHSGAMSILLIWS